MSRQDPLGRLTTGLGELADYMRRRSGPAPRPRILVYDRRGQGRELDLDGESGRTVLAAAEQLLERATMGSEEPDSAPEE